MRYIVKNGKIILPNGVRNNAVVLIDNGNIVDILPEEQPLEGEIIDAMGCYVSPGFIDIHLHGGGGADFMDCTSDSYHIASLAHLKHGTTSILPTVLSAEQSEILQAIDCYSLAKKHGNIKSRLLGLRLEGPYFSPQQAGAQKPGVIRSFNCDEYMSIIERADGEIKMWDAAPEIDGADAFAQAVQTAGIRLSIGHSNADFDTVVEAFDKGWQHITHLFSSMSSIRRVNSYRVAGVLEAAFYLSDMDVELILDGCHLPKSLVEYTLKLKNNKHIAIITDAMRAAGQNVSESWLGAEETGVRVIVEDGVCKLPSRESFAGSIATGDKLLKTMLSFGVDIVKAIKMLTINPLNMLGIKIKTGQIKAGYKADLCFFDENINVSAVMVNGEFVS